ncbi:MAG: hypothetical protein SZ59_C0002G0152 [candidate division TM6 bacterium GW2011_GWF2_28_16]|nr:MAG: hypothetical protein SZ59_C0002G0152 [candidate division TM6 bacterium GW2011_GWF2_28_16]
MNKNILLILLALAVTNICSAFDVVIKNKTKKDWNISITHALAKKGDLLELNIKKGKNIKINNFNKILSMPNNSEKSLISETPLMFVSAKRLVKKINNMHIKNVIQKIDNVEKDSTFTIFINEIETSNPEFETIIRKAANDTYGNNITNPCDGIVYFLDFEE